jgi:hypothetical protein
MIRRFFYEYFVTNNQWAQNRMIARLSKMGVSPYGKSLDEIAKIKPEKMPKKIHVNLSGKFPEIVRVDF